MATYVKMSNSKSFPGKEQYARCKSPFLVQHWELRAFRALVDTTRGVHGQCAQGLLFTHRVRYAFDPLERAFSRFDIEDFFSYLASMLGHLNKVILHSDA